MANKKRQKQQKEKQIEEKEEKIQKIQFKKKLYYCILFLLINSSIFVLNFFKVKNHLNPKSILNFGPPQESNFSSLQRR